MNNLAKFREERRLSQDDLADMIGSSQPTIQRAESEHGSAKLDTYKRCADALGVTLSDIFTDRSEIEDALLRVFRNAKSHDDRAKLMNLLLVAEGLPPIDDTLAN